MYESEQKYLIVKIKFLDDIFASKYGITSKKYIDSDLKFYNLQSKNI